jgi:chromosome segregation protein
LHVTRLRLAGFKSFVEAADFPVEPGLTGVIGPNGCGKSNLLEALRWVMGATSAKAMRGEGMDDVIFSGSAGRPARNHAEVVMTLDNSDRSAPAAFAAEPVLQVSRRIDRGAGSTYRINGVEVRARDVQLLFADASTGANSPALVRQGQISELIAARPQNRRRILEEAAGVAGLHGRRHEAQLRVKAAEANLTRLEDLAREVETQHARLRREARATVRYKALAAEIRKVDAALRHARWREAAEACAAAREAALQAVGHALSTAREAAAASAALLAADAALPSLRDAATAAAAVLARLTLEADRAEREHAEAVAASERAKAEIARIGADRAREARIAEDAGAALGRLTLDLDRVLAEIAAAPERTPELRARAGDAERAGAAAQAEVERLGAEVARGEAEVRAAADRVAQARAALARTDRALAQARAERAALGAGDGGRLAEARAACLAADAQEATARAALEAAEIAARAAAEAETPLRLAARAAEDELGRRRALARGLADVARAAGGSGEAPSMLEHVAPQPGLEAALAAALGDDLAIGLDAAAPAHWSGREPAPAPAWPPGVAPLAVISAPAALAARLAFVGLVGDRADGARLAALSPPGVRLVSREGDLWRWDGLTVRAEAPRPARVRLEQKTRLAALEAEVAALEPAAMRARDAHAAAQAQVAAATRALTEARAGPGPAAARARRARQELEVLEREAARREAQAGALDAAVARLAAERAEAGAEVDAALAVRPAQAAGPDLAQALAAARAAAAAAREQAFAARSAFEREAAAQAGRARRREQLERELGDWRRRAAAAAERLHQLAAAETTARAALDAARAAPEALARRRLDLADALATAQTRQDGAGSALAAAETARAAAERTARAADARAADAREGRGACEARLESAAERLALLEADLTDATGLAPAELGRRIAADAVALPAGAPAMEAHLAALERDLQALGPVNLCAEDEAAALGARLEGLAADRQDLAEALSRLRQAIAELNAEGRERLIAAFEVIDRNFRELFIDLFGGGAAELKLVESEDPLESGLEIYACPPGKRMAVMSLMSGGEQALTAVALIFAVFLSNPAPICVLDEVDAPLDDANVDRFCNLLEAMRRRASTRFLTITHNPLTMSRMDRLFGVTMRERGVSQLVSVDLRRAEAFAES